MKQPARNPVGIATAAAIGAVAGVVGTLVMSLLMLPANWLGWLGTQPPRRVADVLIDEADPDASESERRAGTTVVHLAIGAVAGAGLAAVREARGGPRLTPAIGAALGSAFWAVNYIILAPAAGLFPRPDHDRPGRPPVMLAANALFGVVTAALIEGVLARTEMSRSG